MRLRDFLDKLFPYIPKCVGCGIEKGVDGYTCPKCRAVLDDLKAGETTALGFPAYSVYRYEGMVKSIVTGYKYGGKKWLSRYMGDVLCGAIAFGEVDMICAVPLHKKRRASRGFDQAEELSRHVAQTTGIPFVRALRRVRNTKTQTKLSQQARRDNIRGAFEKLEPVHGNVVLVDDVLTTGATAAACASVLMEAGARSVFVLTFARAVYGK